MRYGLEALSDRERQILDSFADHGTNQLVAESLGLAQQTVKNHVSNIIDKLNANNLAHALAIYLRNAESWPQVDRRRSQRRSGNDRRQNRYFY